MKHLSALYIAITASIFMHTMLACDKKNDTFLQATEQFKAMRVAQVRNMNIHALNPEQLTAFKSLAKSIFSQDIASAGCFSQANRRKYEVMYQKIGEIDARAHSI